MKNDQKPTELDSMIQVMGLEEEEETTDAEDGDDDDSQTPDEDDDDDADGEGTPDDDDEEEEDGEELPGELAKSVTTIEAARLAYKKAMATAKDTMAETQKQLDQFQAFGNMLFDADQGPIKAVEFAAYLMEHHDLSLAEFGQRVEAHQKLKGTWIEPEEEPDFDEMTPVQVKEYYEKKAARDRERERKRATRQAGQSQVGNDQREAQFADAAAKARKAIKAQEDGFIVTDSMVAEARKRYPSASPAELKGAIELVAGPAIIKFHKAKMIKGLPKGTTKTPAKEVADEKRKRKEGVDLTPNDYAEMAGIPLD